MMCRCRIGCHMRAEPVEVHYPEANEELLLWQHNERKTRKPAIAGIIAPKISPWDSMKLKSFRKDM